MGKYKKPEFSTRGRKPGSDIYDVIGISGVEVTGLYDLSAKPKYIFRIPDEEVRDTEWW